MKTIGILGGMGPLATVDLYKKITVHTAATKDQEHIHIIIDSNPAIPDRTQCIIAGGESPIPEMTKSIHRLEGAGADFLIMPCNTAHYFYDQLTSIASVPILNMLDATVSYIKEHFPTNKTIGLLASDGTVQSGIYDVYFQKAGIELVKPKENQTYVMEFIYEGIKKNRFDIGTERLFKAVRELEDMGAIVHVLGCTELSAATDIYDFDRTRFIDPLEILAERAIEMAGGKVANIDVVKY